MTKVVQKQQEEIEIVKTENDNAKRDNMALKSENELLREKLVALADRQQALEDMFLAMSTSPKEKLVRLGDSIKTIK